MVDFRRWITAIAATALLAGVAAAQTNLSCATNTGGVGTVAKNIRSEGFTELVGDMVFACTGGVVPTSGNLPQANITVFLNTAITSRLLASNGNSEVLLLLDEPNGSVNGVATARTDQTLCNTPTFGCAETPSDYATGPNVYQGIVSGQAVTFYGVPIMPTGTTGGFRYFRITNLRANATAVGGTANVPGTVLASVSSNLFSVANPTQTVGFATPGLNVAASLVKPSNNNAYAQCAGATKSYAALLDFSEGFATAFQPRFAGMLVGGSSTISQVPQKWTIGAQNIPGVTYNSESGFIPSNPSFITGAGYTAGVADWGTRLKANFSNIPAGVTVYVPVTNYIGGNTANAGVAADINAVQYAQLLLSETQVDTAGSFNSGLNTLPVATAGSTGYVALTVTNGTASAVWEVVNSQPTSLDSFYFPAFVTFAANQSPTSPLAGTININMSLAPNPSNGAFAAQAGANPASVSMIPRFVDTSSPQTSITFVPCQTDLLFPFVTSQAGFDTGIAIANTSKDVFGTVNQAGTCALNFFGQNAPTTVPTIGPIAAGDTNPADFATLASTVAPNFEGYMIAVCNFQFAHGFAFIADNALGYAMGYLAEVMTNGYDITPPARKSPGPPNAEWLGQ